MPVVRAANTGISAFISSKGDVTGKIQNEKGETTFVRGFHTEVIYWNTEPTLYRQFGFLFPYLNALLWIWMLVYFVRSGVVFGKEIEAES